MTAPDAEGVSGLRLTKEEADSLACRCHEAICPLHNEASDGYVEFQVSDLIRAVERILADRLEAERERAYTNGLDDHRAHDCCTGRLAAHPPEPEASEVVEWGVRVKTSDEFVDLLIEDADRAKAERQIAKIHPGREARLLRRIVTTTEWEEVDER